MKNIITALLTLIVAGLIAICSSYSGYEVGYNKGYQAGLNYTPETMQRIQKLHNITSMDSAIEKSKQRGMYESK